MGQQSAVSVSQVYNIACVCHEANRAYCQTLGDDTQVPWAAAPQWQRESAMMGVRDLIKDPSLSPEEMHERWCRHKLAEGWKYGPEKNVDKKEHPCMVPFDHLPEEQRVKDHLFHAIVRTLAKLPAGHVHVQ